MNEVNEMSSTVLDAVATTSSAVLQQPSTKLVVLTIINSVLLLAIILLIAVLIRLKKSGKQLIFNIGFGKRKDKNNNSKKNDDSKKLSINKDAIVSNMMNHRFFTSIKYKYVGIDYNFTFENYEMLIEHGVKDELDELQNFKKLIASHFLSDCIFKYLFDSVKAWVDSVVEEFRSMEDYNEDYIPVSMCDIIEYLVHFTKQTTHMSSQLRLTFNGKIIDGIPNDFVKYFCKIVNKDLNVIQGIISSIIYTTNVPWYSKILEILDLFELVIEYIKDSVDYTLIILNGQLERYLEDLMND